MRFKMRLPAVISALLVVGAACGDDVGTTTTTQAPVDTAAPEGTAAPVTTQAPPETAAPTTSQPAAVELDLEPYVDPDPDPMETIEPLTGVTVSIDDAGNPVFSFAESLYGGVGVQLTGLAESDFLACDYVSSADNGGNGPATTCFAQTAAGFETGDPVPNDPSLPELSVTVPLEIADGSVSITVNGLTLTGTGLRFDDGPLFVQIDFNGNLTAPVTRRTGTVSVAALTAILHM